MDTPTASENISPTLSSLNLTAKSKKEPVDLDDPNKNTGSMMTKRPKGLLHSLPIPDRP
jgi:hypothetical protein